MNKLLIMLAYFCVGISMLIGSEYVTFSFNGYQQGMSSPAMNCREEKTEERNSSQCLRERLNFWTKKLCHCMWRLEKSVSDMDAAAVKENVTLLRSCLAEMCKEPDAEIVFLSCYPLVLESVARILHSPGIKMMPQELLGSSLGMEFLPANNCRHLLTFAKMLILSGKIYQYRMECGKYPQKLALLQLEGDEILDGWGEEIMLNYSGNNFFLSSKCGKKTKTVNILEYVPVFRKSNCHGMIVFASSFSELRRQLWDSGQLCIGDLHIILDKARGRQRTTTSEVIKLPWFDDELELDLGWFAGDSDDKTVFHELMHTWSDDGESNDNFKNSHMLESLYNTSFSNWIIYKHEYKKIFE